MKKLFAEIGLGNDTFFSTEFEEGETEFRVPKFVIPQKIIGIYFRFWVGKRVLIISTENGFELQSKNRNKLKILFGLAGTSS